MTKTIKYAGLLAGLAVLFTIGCKKDKPKTVPSVTTVAATEITTTSAKPGGKITGNGGADITERGVVYSSTVSLPTIADNKMASTGSDNDFTVSLSGLSSGTSYHFRAYATNSVGTAYGDVMDFTTGNAAPTVTNVTINGTAEANKTLKVTYTYSDAESDPQSGTTFQWYVANDAAGTGATAITGATKDTFLITDAQQGKYIAVGVTPMASAGTTPGTEVKSNYVGAIGEATTVTFTYNGQTVTYGIISRPSGKKWLDRNLGALRVANAVDDYQAYGDLFQWGRLADGHQLIHRTGTTEAEMSLVNGKVGPVPSATVSVDNPGHSNFILVDGSVPTDWRIPQNNDLWQGVNGINNPCPAGWRIPTIDEWVAENFGASADAFNKLKLTLTGAISFNSGAIQFITYGIYWSSTIGSTNLTRSKRILFNDTTPLTVGEISRATGHACRCIKD